jgi:hypothetical protein
MEMKAQSKLPICDFAEKKVEAAFNTRGLILQGVGYSTLFFLKRYFKDEKKVEDTQQIRVPSESYYHIKSLFNAVLNIQQQWEQCKCKA